MGDGGHKKTVYIHTIGGLVPLPPPQKKKSPMNGGMTNNPRKLSPHKFAINFFYKHFPALNSSDKVVNVRTRCTRGWRCCD